MTMTTKEKLIQCVTRAIEERSVGWFFFELGYKGFKVFPNNKAIERLLVGTEYYEQWIAGYYFGE